MKTLNNLHGNPLYVGSSVYYGNHIAEVVKIGIKNVSVTFTDYKFNKTTKKVNLLTTHLLLIHNANVNGIEYDGKSMKYIEVKV